MTKYFGIPFANSGNKSTIPDASQPSGDVSFEDGWTPDYEKDQATDPNAKDVSRQSENYFKFVVTESLKELQEYGFKLYDALVNYPVNARVIGSDGVLYNCQIANGPATSVKDPVGLSTGEWVQDIPLNSLIQGGEISNAVDADHDITVQPCIVPDNLKAEIIQLKAAITKQIDAAWVAGDNAGGLFSGTVAVNTEYNVFLIKKDSDGSIDAGFDTSLTAANIPVGYTAYRRVGSVFTDGSSNIRGFVYEPDACFFRYKAPITDINDTTLTAGVYETGTITIPKNSVGEYAVNATGDDEDVILSFRATDGNFGATVLGIAFTGIAPTLTGIRNVFCFPVDSNSQLEYTITTPLPNTLTVTTLGYFDQRR